MSPEGRRSGFAMAIVVFLLFAVGVASATAYQVMLLEAEMSQGSQDQGDALAAAEAGLHRYLAESLGPPDTVVYTVGDDTATVIPRRIVVLDDSTDLYLIRSEGLARDVRRFDAPARRVVQQYARLHKDPVALHAALLVTEGNITVTAGDTVSGIDGTSACADSILGAATTGSVTSSGVTAGFPAASADFGAAAPAVLDSVEVRWDILEDPDFGVGLWDGSWPSFASLPPDSFPVVRVTGDFLGLGFFSGRGALIVPGTLFMVGGWTWDGIVLAGRIANLNPFTPSRVRGVLVGGLDGAGQGNLSVDRMTVRLDRCYADAANRNLAYLEPVDSTRWEGF